MKKIIYLLLLFIPLLTFAQIKEVKPLTDNEKTFFKQGKNLFRGYVVAGLNFTQIDGDKMAGYNHVGANVGGGVFVTYTNKFTNSLEISYTMRGAKSGITHTQNTGNYSWYQMDYIEIPLMFNYHDFKIAIFSAGFSYTQMIRNNFVTDFQSLPTDIYKSNLDIIAGVTFLFKNHWGLNFKYNYSILNSVDNGGKRGTIFSEPAKNSSQGNGDLSWYHNVLTFRAMYVF
tara:strand:- start:7465 stop:8151 length:687 start_codon:yes stop_codon:yes gene_type:complete